MGRARGSNQQSFEAVLGARRGHRQSGTADLDGALERASRVVGSDLGPLAAAVRSLGPAAVRARGEELAPLLARFRRRVRDDADISDFLGDGLQAGGLLDERIDARHAAALLERMLGAADTGDDLQDLRVQAWAREELAGATAGGMLDWLGQDDAGEEFIAYAGWTADAYEAMRGALGLQDGTPTASVLGEDDAAAAFAHFARELMVSDRDVAWASSELARFLRERLQGLAADARSV